MGMGPESPHLLREIMRDNLHFRRDQCALGRNGRSLKFREFGVGPQATKIGKIQSVLGSVVAKRIQELLVAATCCKKRAWIRLASKTWCQISGISRMK